MEGGPLSLRIPLKKGATPPTAPTNLHTYLPTPHHLPPPTSHLPPTPTYPDLPQPTCMGSMWGSRPVKSAATSGHTSLSCQINGT